MKQIKPAFAALAFLLIAGNARLWPLTEMVAVQVDVGQASVSPDGLNRAKVLATDLESLFMDQLFDAGHITFNAPAEIMLADGERKATLVENLLALCKSGGASLLVLCRLKISEPVPNQALVLGPVSVSAIPIYSAADFPVTWSMPAGTAASDAEFRQGMKRIAGMLVAKINSLPREVAGMGRRD